MPRHTMPRATSSDDARRRARDGATRVRRRARRPRGSWRGVACACAVVATATREARGAFGTRCDDDDDDDATTRRKKRKKRKKRKTDASARDQAASRAKWR
jgi:hypothetical protein